MTATVVPFAEVDVSALALSLEPGYDFVPEMLDEIADELLAKLPGCVRSDVGLFTLEPGQEHPAHTDEQPPEWVTRVHVPIVTNDKATVTTDEGTMHMRAGVAYKFDTRQRHAVRNDGNTPRVHLVFEVRKK